MAKVETVRFRKEKFYDGGDAVMKCVGRDDEAGTVVFARDGRKGEAIALPVEAIRDGGASIERALFGGELWASRELSAWGRKMLEAAAEDAAAKRPALDEKIQALLANLGTDHHEVRAALLRAMEDDCPAVKREALESAKAALRPRPDAPVFLAPASLQENPFLAQVFGAPAPKAKRRPKARARAR